MNKQDVMEMIRSGEISDADIREAIGGGTRVQAMTDGLVKVRIKATRATTTAMNKQARNALAQAEGADEAWTRVSNQLFERGSVSEVSAPYHAVRELLTVGKAENDAGNAANESGVNFGFSKWDDVYTTVLRRRVPALQSAVDALRIRQESGKQEMRLKWDRIKAETQARLGGLWNDEMFPDFEDWADKWTIEMEVRELEAADLRINMDEVARGDLVMQTRRATLKHVSDNLLAAWGNFQKVYTNTLTFAAATLLNDSDTVRVMNDSKEKRKSDRAIALQDNFLDNLRNQTEQAVMIGDITDDSTLVQVSAEIDVLVPTALEVDTLRKNPAMRESLGKSIKRQADRLAGAAAATEQSIADAAQEVNEQIGDDLLAFA